MPIIPRHTEQARIQSSAPVQIASTGDARTQGEAVQGFGQALAQFGEKQIAIDRNLKTDEFQSEIHNVALQAKDYADKNASADGSDYGAKYYEKAQPGLDQAMDKYAGSDPSLRRDFTSRANRLRGDIDTSILIKSGQMMEQNNFARLDNSGNNSADRIRQSPTPEMVDAEVKIHGALVDKIVADGGMAAENADRAKRAYNEKASRALIQGLAEKGQYGKIRNLLGSAQLSGPTSPLQNPEIAPITTGMDPRQAQDLGLIDAREAKALIDKGEMHKIPTMSGGDKIGMTPQVQMILQGLSPSERGSAFEHATAQIKAKAEVSLNDLHQTQQAVMQMAYNGDPGLTQAHIADAKKAINMNPNLTALARARSMDNLNAAVAVHDTLLLAANTPRSQWGDLLSKADNNMKNGQTAAGQIDPRMAQLSADPVALNNRSGALDRLQTSLAQVASQQEKDPATSIMMSTPNLETLWKGTKDGDTQGFDRYATTAISKQNYLGIPADKQRLLPLAEAQGKAQQLALAPDPDSANQMLAQMQTQYGRHFPQIMDELSRTDKSLGDYKVAAMVDPGNRGTLIDALMNQKAVEAAIKQDPQRIGQRAKDINTQAAINMQPFSRALVGLSNDSSGVQTVNSLTSMVALDATREMIRNPNIDIGTAVSKSKEKLIDSNYALINGGVSTIIVPRQIGNYTLNDDSSRIFKTFMDVYSKPDNLKEEFAPYVPKNQNPEQYLSNVRWTTNPSQTGLILVKPRPGGGMDSVIDQYGKPIQKGYADIFNTTDKKVVGANKTVFQKLFGN